MPRVSFALLRRVEDKMGLNLRMTNQRRTCYKVGLHEASSVQRKLCARIMCDTLMHPFKHQERHVPLSRGRI